MTDYPQHIVDKDDSPPPRFPHLHLHTQSPLAAGANPMPLKRGIDKAVTAALAGLKDLSQEVNGAEQISQVGAISANQDQEIGDLLADALGKAGKDGVITVEEAHGIETSLEVV